MADWHCEARGPDAHSGGRVDHGRHRCRAINVIFGPLSRPINPAKDKDGCLESWQGSYHFQRDGILSNPTSYLNSYQKAAAPANESASALALLQGSLLKRNPESSYTWRTNFEPVCLSDECSALLPHIKKVITRPSDSFFARLLSI